MSPGFFDRNPVGKLVTRVTSDVDALNEMFTSGVLAIFEDVFVLVFIVVIMVGMSWRLALLTLAVLPAILYITRIFRRHVREKLPKDPVGDCADQQLHAGACERHAGGAAVQPGAEGV